MTKIFYITLNELEKEKTKLTDDLNELKDNIIKLEGDIIKMKNNLNALSGAIQQSNKLIEIATKHGEEDDWVEDFYKKHLKEKKKKK